MVSKEWVIIATERAKRPDHFIQEKQKKNPLPPHRRIALFALAMNP